ncbi:hypothetical protein RB195_002418 [Necator americanus]|uniref:Calponin-homology (CH) domain-containing protein n=1 Tax=Necator americanus TaxID=51031 RepID=A0ABR1DIX3_NECAM
MYDPHPHGKLREHDQEQEVIPAIRLDDAEWKIIQQNTFTRWVNNHLKKAGDSIQSLETDFSDGLKLISLAAVLSQKNVGRFNKKVNFRSQKLENVSLALKFFQDVEHIKIVNIDSSHIVDQNKKLILGLIWTLILHYSISMGWVQERNEGQPEETPKQKLLNWIRSKLPSGMPVTNFTSDWNDGVAVGALVNALVPGAVMDWEQWTPENALENTEKAMQIAQNRLGVEPLITPGELIHPEIDEMSVMTYLSQFPAAKLDHVKRPVQPEEPIVSGSIEDLNDFPVVNMPSEFIVNVIGDGYKPKLKITDPDGREVHHTVAEDNPHKFTVTYTPLRDGVHHISLALRDIALGTVTSIDRGSRTVEVLPVVRLCSYTDRVRVGDVVPLRVEGAIKGVVEVVVVDAVGGEHALAVIEGPGRGVFTCEYVPKHPGLHTLNVFYNRTAIHGSPFPLRAADRNNFFIWGRGINDDGIRINDTVPVYVDNREPYTEHENDIKVKVVTDSGLELPVRRSKEGLRSTFIYTPTTTGKHLVYVTNNNEPIGQSPYKVNISPPTRSRVRAFGTGLEGGVMNQQSVFSVETNGDADRLAFSIEGPSKTEIACQDRGQGAALVAYTPKEPGVYKVNVLAGGEHISESPFVLMVDPPKPGFQPSAARLTGVEPELQFVPGEPVPFRIDTRHTGVVDDAPRVEVLDKDLTLLPTSGSQINPGIYGYSFTPKKSGKYHICASLNGVAIPGSPFPVNVHEPIDLSKLKIFGPGVDGPVKCQEPTHFTIDAKQAGPGAVEVSLADRKGQTVAIDVLDNNDGSFTVKYTAPRPGAYQLNVVFAGAQVPPIEINVEPQVDTSGIRVTGLENADVLRGHRFNVGVDIGNLIPHGSGVKMIANINGKLVEVPMKRTGAASHGGVFIAHEVGKTNVKVLFDNAVVKEANISVRDGCDASKCTATGEGLRSAIVGKPARFDIDAQNAGNGELFVQLVGPAEAKNKCRDNADGSCTVEYVPSVPGEYSIGICYGSEKKKDHVPGSPFRAIVDYPYDPSRISVNGLRSNSFSEARVGTPVSFDIDASLTHDAPITVTVPPVYQQPLLEKDKISPRLYHVRFTPVGEPGSIVPVEIRYDGKPIPFSPFRIKLLPETEVAKIKVSGLDGSAHPFDVSASREAAALVDVSNCGKVSDLKASVVGPDARPRDCVVKEATIPQHYEVRFPTDMAGHYKADIFINGEKAGDAVDVYAKKSGHKDDVKLMEKLNCAQVPIGDWSIVSYDRNRSEPSARLAVVPRSPTAVRYDVESKSLGSGRFRDLVKFHPTKPGPNTLDVYYGGDKVDEIYYEAVPADHGRALKSHVQQVQQDPIEAYERKYYSGVSSNNNNTKEYTSSRYSTSPTSDRYRYAASPPSVLSNKSSFDQKPSSVTSSPPPSRSTASSPPQRSVTPPTTARSFTSPPVSSPNSTAFYTREFKLNVPPYVRPESLKAFVTMPSKNTDQAEIIDNHDGTIQVKYVPKKHGAHELSIVQDGAHISGSPLRFFVDGYKDGFATVYGPGLLNSIVGEPAAFTVCAKGSAAKELSVSIEGPAQSTIKIHDNKDGTCSVTWVPPVPGEYKVHVKLGGKEVHDSPFTVLVAGEGQKRAHLSVGSTSEVALNITQSELKGISASIKSPSGIEEPCFVRLIEGGRLGVSFTPREAGEHLISVKRDGKLLPKAPFKIKVDKSQVGDASKVEVSGSGKMKAECLKDNEILIDTSKAGYGGLSVSVQGPSKAELTCKEVKAGLIKVNYKPTEPGVYVVAVKFADNHVKDSPFTVHCTGKGAGRKVEEIHKKAEQAGLCLPNKEALVFLKLPNVTPMNSGARVLDPKGRTEDVEMRDLGDQFFQIRFMPKMEGVHHLSILHKDAHIYGSPLQYTVGPFAEGGAHKVRASGLGVVRGETNFPQSFNIYTREAGAGNLSVTMEGPSKAVMAFHDHKDGNCHVQYKVDQPGEYIVAIKFNDQHIADSPFKVFIAPATGEARKLELAQFHDQGIPAGKAFTFTVLTHRARGHLEAKVVTPTNEIETIDIVPIEDGESYALRFLPKESGNHYIHVTLDGAPMRDSPFRLRVGGRDQCDPTALSVTGDGIRRGTTGQKCEFVVSTANAGAGVLNVQLDGPSKATLDAYELERGYKVRYTPLAPGDYIAAIKYNGIHIPGSPFKIHVEGKVLGGNGYNESSFVKIDAVAKTSKGTVATVPEYKGDASKVEAKGAGLNKFFPGRPAVFTIDTAVAGPNILMVGVVTTKGPCEEVVVKHHGNGHYIVTYKVPDRVKGFIFIKYGDQEIPGSPFAIEP